jgi:hypothetical protein
VAMAPRERGVVVAVPSGPPVRARGMLAPYVAVGRIFGLTGRERYRELRRGPLYWPSPSTPRTCSA